MELVARIHGNGLAFGEQESRVEIRTGSSQTAYQFPPGVDRRSFTIKGHAMDGDLVNGLEYRFIGEWRNHKKHGPQFNFTSFTKMRPTGRGATIRYLTTIRHIGPTIAQRIVDTYGEQALDALVNKPKEVSQLVRGLTYDKAVSASDQIHQEQDVATAKTELLDLLSDHGVHAGIIRKAVETWGLAATDRVTKNPYILLKLPGVGFLTADRVYLGLGRDPAALKRQTLCLAYAISERTSDTWVSRDELVAELEAKISSACVRADKAIRLGVRAGVLRATSDGKLLTIARRADDELSLANDIARLCAAECKFPVDVRNVEGISDHQRRQLRKAVGSNVGVLEGSPGTGKTYTIGRLCKLFFNGGDPKGRVFVHCCAFTGKAAQRMATMIGRAVGTKVNTYTIHRLLGTKILDSGKCDTGNYDGTGARFNHDRDNPLPIGVYVIDEGSMNGTEITARLFEAIPAGSRVLIVGDTNQLPPVPHGCVMRDMMGVYGIGVGRLTEIHRNSGMIVKACASIRDTGLFEPCKKLVTEDGHNLVHVEARGPRIMSWLKVFMERVYSDSTRDEGGVPDSVKKVRIVGDKVQVLTPINKGSIVGRESVNRELQAMLNPVAEEDGCAFRVGDKVICRENGQYETGPRGKSATHGDYTYTIFVANGQQGTVTRVHDRDSRGGKSMDIVVNDGSADYTINVDIAADCPFELAYAITGHLSQGDEWPYAVTIFDDSWGAKNVMCREWLTTCVSRGSIASILIGPWLTVRHALAKVSVRNRVTCLRELLDERMELAVPRKVGRSYAEL